MGVNANNRVPSDIETASEAFSVAKTMLEEIIEKTPGCQVSFTSIISHLVSTVCFNNRMRQDCSEKLSWPLITLVLQIFMSW